MVIMHNLAAMNGNRMYGINNKKKASVTEKLSSGYRINRAADDAAGLAISEKMRRQIRGLSQGADNIKDGMSLVQVADGALDEVTACLQRINELSIQAYNGTNQKEDQEYIQSEIDQLITEVQRIADTTTFNEILVLKGNPKVSVKIEHDKAIDGFVYQEREATIPEWLKVSSKLEPGNPTGITLQNLDRTSNAVFKTNTNPDEYKYYGDDNSELNKIATDGQSSGLWSDTVDDNASAIIDFGELANVTTPEELYGKLFDLIGTSIGVPCGTCTEYYGVSFTGSELGLEVENGGTKIGDKAAESISYLNLSEWNPWPSPDDKLTIFDKIRNLRKELDLDSTKDILTETQDLAKDIAKKLCNETVSKITTTISGNKNHFNRASKITSPTQYEYALMIYDFRDVDKLATEESADSLVQVSSKAWSKVPYSMLAEGTIVEVEQPLWIQCSSNEKDKLPIDLPLLDDFSLGINSYDISTYDEKTVYSQKYLKELEEWEKNCNYILTTETIPKTEARTEIQRKPVVTIDYDRNGEPFTKTTWKEVSVTIPEQPERTIQKKVLDPSNPPKPQPGPDDVYLKKIYNPSDVKNITDALSYVSMYRANLGATQNRLEHAYFNNLNTYENTTYAESRIRDADMAKEMVDFSNLNVLQQAGQAVLAQANQNNQNVLSLLQ